MASLDLVLQRRRRWLVAEALAIDTSEHVDDAGGGQGEI